MGALPATRLAAPPSALRPPLGLPSGSVRATLALVLSATMWYLVYRQVAVPGLLASAVLLVVAFYFGVRSTGSPAATAAQAAPGQTTPVSQPLYLPRGAVRTILLGGFLTTIVYVWATGREIPEELVLILQVLASYVVGYSVSVAVNRRIEKGLGPNRAIRWARNLIALLALGVTGVVCSSLLFQVPAFVPTDAEKILAWVVAFYFGSRLGP